MKPNLCKFKKPLNEFISMPDYMSYLSIHDSSRENKGLNEGKKLALWARNGKHLVGLESFVELVNDVKFDMVECLYDDSNSMIESKKGVRKIYDRTKAFVDSIYAEEEPLIKNTQVMMPLIGNNDWTSRKFFVDHILESNYKFNGNNLSV